jgi:hypothetical protein
MRRFGVVVVACAAVGAVGLTAFGGGSSGRRLPLRSLLPATNHLTAIVDDRGRSRLALVNPSTLRTVRASAWRVGAPSGWVTAPNGRRVALAQCRRKCGSFVLRFADTATLRWASGALALDGALYAGLWPRPRTLYALVGGETALELDTIDTVTRRIVTSKPIAGPVLQIARSADALVVLVGAENAIGPARMLVIGSDGAVRTVTVQRILAGRHYDAKSRDPIGTTNLPALAVDPGSGIAYLIDPSGLIAAVDLGDLSVTYHQLGSGSLLTRIAAWLTPPAEAKGTNGSSLSAQWLGRGLIAVAGTEETASARVDSYRPTGLRIIDTRNWSARMLDQQADTFMVADGLLLATGTRSRFGSRSQHMHGEGLAAYGPDGSLRWRLNGLGEFIYLVQTYGSVALVDGEGTNRLIDLESGRVMHGPPSPAAGQLLLGPGSPAGPGGYY